VGWLLKPAILGMPTYLNRPLGPWYNSVARILAHEMNGLPYSGHHTALYRLRLMRSNAVIDDIRDFARKSAYCGPVKPNISVHK